MKKSQGVDNTGKTVDVMEAIYQRRAVRDFLPEKVTPELIKILLDAALQAPSALHEEPRAFAVIQNKDLLDRLSASSKEALLDEKNKFESQQTKHILEVVKQKDYHVFYNAGTLIVIYSTFSGPFVTADCWLAAENLLLAAYAKGLGSCVIGFALPALNLPEWKKELDIPLHMMPVASIILGWPAHTPLPPQHQPAVILSWK